MVIGFRFRFRFRFRLPLTLNIQLYRLLNLNLSTMIIKIYSTPSCPYCHLAKQYFVNRKVDFTEIDVAKDQKKAQEMVELSGQMGGPVIVIDDQSLPAGRQVIVGFDQEKIEAILKQ